MVTRKTIQTVGSWPRIQQLVSCSQTKSYGLQDERHSKGCPGLTKTCFRSNHLLVYTLCRPILTHFQVNGGDASPRAYSPISLAGVGICEVPNSHQESNTLPPSLAHFLSSSADHQPNGALDLWNDQLPIVPELANDNILPVTLNGSSLDKTSRQIHPFFTIAGHAMDVNVKTNLVDNGTKRPLTPNDEQPKAKMRKLPSNTVYRGQSKSAIWARRQNEKYQQGKLKNTGVGRFKVKISQLDQYVVIVDSKAVRHLTCGKSLTMKASFDIGNFKTHAQKCSGPPKSKKLSGAGMLPLTSLFKPYANAP